MSVCSRQEVLTGDQPPVKTLGAKLWREYDYMLRPVSPPSESTNLRTVPNPLPLSKAVRAFR